MKYIPLLILSFVARSLFGQDTLVLTLEDVVRIARQNSIQSQIANNQYKNAFWGFRSYNADMRPELNLNATIPSFSRSISNITLPDGTVQFISQSYASSSLNLALSQEIPFTGGRVYAGSGLQRIDILSDPNTVSYLTSPFFIGIQQPVLSYNTWKWRRQVEPLVMEEAERGYLEDLEDVSIIAVDRFFAVHLSRINLEIAEFNLKNNDSIYRISEGRYNLGKIAENDLLQTELTVLNAQVAKTVAENEIQNTLARLRQYLGFSEDQPIKLVEPSEIPFLQIDPRLAVTYARELRSDPVAFQRQQLQAEQEIARVKGSTGFSANIFAEYGLQNSAAELGTAYQDPQSFQNISLSLDVPILDWGKAKSQREIARANLDLVQSQIEQSRQNFETEVQLRVQQFNLQGRQVAIAAKADTVSRRRFNVALNRYLIGKTDNTDLNIASAEEDQARRAYISALNRYWSDFYAVRKLTLFDFSTGQRITGIPELGQ